jgi:hypothetical protein
MPKIKCPQIHPDQLLNYVGEYLRTLMTARSALMQVGLQVILVRGLSLRQASLSYRFVGEEAISALTGLHCKTKLHSTEADSVPTLQCKRNIVKRAGEVLEERHPTGQGRAWGGPEPPIPPGMAPPSQADLPDGGCDKGGHVTICQGLFLYLDFARSRCL